MATGNQVEDRIIAIMKRFGYTGSDARTYIALLRTHPATGYELAARGGVPRSAIYGVLKRLESAGLVNAIQGKPARYIPLQPDKLIQHLEGRFTQDVKDFREATAQISVPDTGALTWTVTGYDALMAEASRLIDAAEETVFCSLWRKEGDLLTTHFQDALSRGVDVTLFSFTPLKDGIGEVLSYGINEDELAAHWSSKLMLISDRGHLLVGATEGTQRDRAVVSEERLLVDMAIGNLVLDITLFGERNAMDTSGIVERLTQQLAPIESLADRTPI